MRKMRLASGLLVVLLCLSFSGCSFVEFDAKAQLVPPLASGDEVQVQRALEEFIASQNQSYLTDQYKLRYPREGSYRTAFIMEDIDSDGDKEAIVFYSTLNATETIHVNYLRKIETGWQSISDLSSDTTDIREVNFADMDGDGTKEMVVGWVVGTTRDDHLGLYHINNTSLTEIGSYVYTKVLLDKITSSSKSDLLVFHISNTDYEVDAKLLTVLDGEALELGKVKLDGYIESMDNFAICSFGESEKGIFFDGYKEGTDLVTELIYWDGEYLSSPFYDESSNISSLTARSSGISSQDVDGDGIPEWPRSEKMHGNSLTKETDQTSWLTEWCSWDYKTGDILSKFYSITVPEDHYYFRIEEDWLTSLTSFYNKDLHRLYLCTEDGDGNPVVELVLYPRDFLEEVEEDASIPSDEDEFKEIYLRKSDSYVMARFNAESTLRIDENEVLYRLVSY
ncbi:MAG: hypothetical protein J6Z00_01410 [Clostridia bacterium]|nr:hypothetical protein [Clostridia bacterium]